MLKDYYLNLLFDNKEGDQLDATRSNSYTLQLEKSTMSMQAIIIWINNNGEISIYQRCKYYR